MGEHVEAAPLRLHRRDPGHHRDQGVPPDLPRRHRSRDRLRPSAPGAGRRVHRPEVSPRASVALSGSFVLTGPCIRFLFYWPRPPRQGACAEPALCISVAPDSYLLSYWSVPRSVAELPVYRLAMNAELEARGFSQGFGRNPY